MDMDAIEVRNLTKTFRVKIKPPGLKNSFKALFKPQYRWIEAVKNLNFTVKSGETLAFIGPNGSGKSTTIKMLTGILFPTSGEARVLGFNPWKERKKLSFHIGSVFGQKSQLWYHLPAMETFYLFSKIYELDSHTFRQRLDYLIDLLEIKSFVHTPVRKLSLGQRMRAELVACLLHKPSIIFLDEPTIGLDVVAKQILREHIRTINRTEGTTIFITSHDAGDIETLCERVIILNLGKIIYDRDVNGLKKTYLHRRVIEATLNTPGKDPFTCKGCTLLEKTDYKLKVTVDTHWNSTRDVINQLLNQYDIEDITITEPPLEEIIRQIYKEQEEE